MTETKPMRKYYIDNIRWATVILVIIYHVIYIFNSVGVISNLNVQGIPQMEAFLPLVYPWFMTLLFLVAGMSARYSLEKRSPKTFLKERTKKLLIPSIAGIFLLSWITGWVTNHYTNMFTGEAAQLPGFVKWFTECLCGIGPLWFAHELFLTSVVLVILISIDKKDKLWELGGKANYLVLAVLLFFIWGSSKVLNTPVIVVYRNGIYIFMFLIGYYIFSHEQVTDLLVKIKLPMLIIAIITGVTYTLFYYGENYTSDRCLESLFTNFYLWVTILAILGCGKAWWDKKNAFTAYMTKRSFGFYMLHYPFLVLISYLIVTYLRLPMLLNYLLILVLELVLIPLLYELFSRIPIIRLLLLGISSTDDHKRGRHQSHQA